MSDSLAFQVDLFADLMVQIDHPFADRAVVLAAAGLDARRYDELVASWRARFDRDASGALAGRFADAYAERRAAFVEKRRREASGEAPPTDARFLNAEALSFREDAARVAREPVPEDRASPPPLLGAPSPGPAPAQPEAPPLAAPAPPPIVVPPRVDRPSERFAATADIGSVVRALTLPFSPASAEKRPSEPPPSALPRPRIDSGTADISAFVPRPPAPFAATADISAFVPRPPAQFAATADISAFVPRPATPFAAPAAPPPPAPPAPRRRLIRFDPQTGQPLPAPIWVDLPPEPEGQPK